MIYTFDDTEKVDTTNVEEISVTDSTPVVDDEEISNAPAEENASPAVDDEKIPDAPAEEIPVEENASPVVDDEKISDAPVEEIPVAQIEATPINPLDVKGFQIVVPDLGTSGNTFNRKIESSTPEARVLGNASAPKQEKVFVTTREISEDEVPPEIREAIRRKEEQRAKLTNKSGSVANLINAGVNARFASVTDSAEKQIVEQSDEELQRQREERARVKSKLLVDKILKSTTRDAN